MSHLPTLAPLVCIMAAERTTDRPDLFDDARQEGMIAAWQAETARPDAGKTYAMVAARHGVISVLRGRPMTGSDGHQGRQDAADYSDPLTVSEDDGEDASTRLADPSAEAALRAVEDRLVAVDVWAAVKGLGAEDRAIVEAHFIRGLSWPEVALSVRGSRRGANAVRRRFLDHVAPALRGALTHLEGVAA